MQLLGAYESQLATWYYQGLLNLLSQAVQAGDYSGNATFDTATIQQLIAEAQSFAALPTDSAGQRVTDDYLNRPLQLLAIRYASLAQEVSSFTTTANALISVIKKDTSLLDQLISAGSIDAWCKSMPQLGGAQTAQWDFTMGLGKISNDIPLKDPNTGIIYTPSPEINTYLSTSTGLIGGGLIPSSPVTKISINDMTWGYNAGNAQVEQLDGDDWTELSLLEPYPLVTYNKINATIQFPINLPGGSINISNYIQLSGSTIGGMIPTYVRILFTPRQVQRSFSNVASSSSVTLSANSYPFSLNNVNVFSDTTFYSEGTDYTLQGWIGPLGGDSEQGGASVLAGTLTSIDLPSSFTVMFTEMYPSYQCSVNQVDWSEPIMLDIDRPYPDTETLFPPIPWGPNYSFPITDEEGNATGVYMSLVKPLPYELYLLVNNQADTNVGATATLTVQFEQPTYMTGVHLSTYTEYPTILTNVSIVDFENTTTIFQGNTILDRELTINFPRQIVKQAILTFYQQNYTFEIYSVNPNDQLRRSIMAQVQPLLPYAVQRSLPPSPVQYDGVLYEFGFENIYGEDRSSTVPTVFSSGPYSFNGAPEIMRFDCLGSGTYSCYLYYKAYNGNGVIVDENLSGILIATPSCFCFPLASTVPHADINNVDVWISFIHRSTDALIQKFLIQVTSNV